MTTLEKETTETLQRPFDSDFYKKQDEIIEVYGQITKIMDCITNTDIDYFGDYGKTRQQQENAICEVALYAGILKTLVNDFYNKLKDLSENYV